MWTHTETIEIDATPARIWALLCDVPGWKKWNAGIERVEMHGAFANGTTFTMQPPGMDTFVSTLTDVVAGERFTDETVIDGTRFVVHHRIEPLATARCKVVYRAEVEGPGAEEFGPMVTADFSDVLAALKSLAETPTTS